MLLENITQQQIQQFREAFALFDKDGDGVINNNELKTILRSLGYYSTKQQLDIFIATIDQDNSGTIDFRQFLLLISKSLNDKKMKDGLIDAFKNVDKNEDGCLSKIQLKGIIYQNADLQNKQQDQQYFDFILRKLDDGQGLINIQKYINFALQMSQNQLLKSHIYSSINIE